MSKQPDTLHLARWCDDLAGIRDAWAPEAYAAAAAELRRLHAVNAELVEALNIAIRQNEHDMVMTGDELRICCAALSKALGE
jgi:hypothetical protein